MGKHAPKQKFRPGDAFYLQVRQEHIDDSDPCNKDNCMVTRAATAWYAETYGHANSKAKSTNHGFRFQLNGRSYLAVFDHKTAFRIFNYDKAYRTLHSKKKAQKTVRPFNVRMMIESSVAVTKGPPMSDETKERLANLAPRKDRDYKPRPGGVRRELSL